MPRSANWSAHLRRVMECVKIKDRKIAGSFPERRALVRSESLNSPRIE